MPSISYVNGRYVPHRQARVHVEDRGYQFADGVYEVCEVRDGRIIDRTRHLDRLDRSLRELRIAWPVARRALQVIMAEVVARNRVRDGLVYLQVTRGVAPRNHLFPAKGTRPALVVTSRPVSRQSVERRAEAGIAVITVPDNRWERVDIKTVGLLPNVLAREAARAAGADEAWFVDTDGNVTEGAGTSAWIVTPDGVLVTRPDTFGILPGITRRTLMDVCRAEDLSVEERPFSVEEALAAREAFVTAASLTVMPVVAIDGRPVANGAPGSIATALHARFHEIAEAV